MFKHNQTTMKCNDCGAENETVHERTCGFIEEIWGKIELETVCDACEDAHLADI